MPDRAAMQLTAPTLADRLDELAYRVRRLAPSRRDPESYHAEKSEIEHALRGLARAAQFQSRMNP